MNPEATPENPVIGAPALVLRHLNVSDIGQMIEGKGILLAPAFRHVNDKGLLVGEVFDYFMAPADTRFLDDSKQLGTCHQNIQRIANLKDICGHNGTLFHNDTEIYVAAQRDPDQLRLWHMPPQTLVDGHDLYGRLANLNHMCRHKDKGVLKGTFTDKAAPDLSHWYWSCTGHPTRPSSMCARDFASGHISYEHTDFFKISSRPVRAEVRPA